MNKTGSLLITLGVVSIFFCYFFVDRQIVWFLYEHNSRQYKIMRFFSDDIISFIKDLVFVFYIYYFIKLILKKLVDTDIKILLVANAIIIGQFIKDILKGIFGRYWPETFKNNPSLIRDNLYGFNWFDFDNINNSFPSGHATFIFSFSVSMWILFPKYRWLWALLTFLVVVTQLLQYFHFASDLIAGSMLGSIIGYYAAQSYTKKSQTV
ncbi:phosphatase PAP2 family protein [Francisella tularensis subsp. novicida]|uniref:phosphatase PAP2 family protein n=1 Tax=Francisella tularensis TaxID=263 RepID=UPI000CE29A5B|nr:phosphatase PAP2 family protein [Francisella tularensis]AVC44556.1 phosphatase PAP2 family protein [Francisella tularensis subsp. novicida]